MKIETLKEFLLLAEELNFSKTARSLYINQSALSRHIKELEDELGCTLFLRNQQNVRLTIMGKYLVERAQTLVEEHDSIISEIRDLQREENAHLVVGYLFGACSGFFVEACSLFRREHPDTKLEARSMQPDDITSSIKANKIDMGITIRQKGELSSIYDSCHLYDDEFVLMTHRRHKLARQEAVASSDVTDPVLVPKSFPHEATLSKMLREKFASAGISFVESTAIDDVETMPLLVDSPNKITVACGHLGKRFSDRARCLPLSDVDLSFEVVALWKRSKQRQAINDFVDCLTYCLEAHSAF